MNCAGCQRGGSRNVCDYSHSSAVSAAPSPIIESLDRNWCSTLATLRFRSVTILPTGDTFARRTVLPQPFFCTFVAVSAIFTWICRCIRRMRQLRGSTGQLSWVHSWIHEPGNGQKWSQTGLSSVRVWTIPRHKLRQIGRSRPLTRHKLRRSGPKGGATRPRQYPKLTVLHGVS